MTAKAATRHTRVLLACHHRSDDSRLHDTGLFIAPERALKGALRPPGHRGNGGHPAGLLLGGHPEEDDRQAPGDQAVPEDVEHVRGVGVGAGPDHPDQHGAEHVAREREPVRAVLELDLVAVGDGSHEDGGEPGREDRQDLPLVGTHDGREGHAERCRRCAETDQLDSPVLADRAVAYRAAERSGHDDLPKDALSDRIESMLLGFFVDGSIAPKPLLRIRGKLYHFIRVYSTNSYSVNSSNQTKLRLTLVRSSTLYKTRP